MKNYQDYDVIFCKGIQHDCEIGFHNIEQGIFQKLEVDFKAFVKPISRDEEDSTKAIRLDYFEANQYIGDFLKGKKINLIETVADSVADLLLKKFQIQAVEVSVTKYPLNSVKSVTYTCFRERI